MSTVNFFEESKEQSAVKTAIVSKYFWSWAKVIMPQAQKVSQGKFAYLDLFAGLCNISCVNCSGVGWG